MSHMAASTATKTTKRAATTVITDTSRRTETFSRNRGKNHVTAPMTARQKDRILEGNELTPFSLNTDWQKAYGAIKVELEKEK